MREMLLTFGDSFTWGEGLDSHLIKEMFPQWSEKLAEWTERDDKPNEVQRFKHKLTTSIPQLNIRRMESTYGYLLNDMLGTTHISNGLNGGSNIDRFVDLDYFISLFDLAEDTHLKYCVFQLTHVCRDIQHILEEKWNLDIIRTTEEVFPPHYRDAVMGKDYYQWEAMGMFNTALRYVINYLLERFKIMEEKWGTKCFFFLGLGEKELGPSFWEYLYTLPQFVPMIWQGKEYTSFSEIGRLNKLQIRDTTGFHDGHCDNSLHKWLSQYLYLKLNDKL
jgi:hypothetical protein